MNIAHCVNSRIQKVQFSYYSTHEIRALSACLVTNPQIFDTLGHPTPNGLYDPHLGPHEQSAQCKTCYLDFHSCPGHFGHLELHVPCYNPVTFSLMFKLLRSSCLFCYKLCMSEQQVYHFMAKIKLINAGMLVEANEIDGLITSQDGNIEAVKMQVGAWLKHAPTKRQQTTLVNDAYRKLEKLFLKQQCQGKCQNCKAYNPQFRNDGMVKIFQKPLSAKNAQLNVGMNMVMDNKCSEIYVSPVKVMNILKKLWCNESEIMNLLYGDSPQMFFFQVIAVSPSKFRPISKMGDMMFEHAQNTYLVEILKNNIMIRDIKQQEQSWLNSNLKVQDSEKLEMNSQFSKKMIDTWVKLQESINNLIDSSKAPSAPGKIAPPGIRQILEKKEGLFRKHMMGKRVNYAARSVISPDPYIETNEIGIPPVFAKKLTYPEPVTHHNFHQLRQCVVNGPDQWPGATHVQNEDGTLVALGAFDQAGRQAIANQLLTPSPNASKSISMKNVNKKVLRHLRNGDFLLLNRQPTLHKPSIMAHTARILQGERTIRMHYANCNTYNADFDGDEMNAHFPQNEIARAEAMLIARNDFQYLVPTDGGVLRGLIQDHVDAGVDLCSRDTSLTKELYVQLVYSGLGEQRLQSVGNGNIETQVQIGRNGRILVQPPAILKPRPLWTGKQVISTIMDNLKPPNVEGLNLVSKCKIPASQWGPSAPEEQAVLIMDGYLLTGILDKSQFGASSNGLVHAVYEVYGARYAGKILTILGRLFTSYLQHFGFTCRMDDLRLTPAGDELRRGLIEKTSTIGNAVTESYVKETTKMDLRQGYEKVLRNEEMVAGLDSAMKSATNKSTSEIISSCIPSNLYKPFPANNMQVMTVSGAKGSSVNVSQISCLLGQQELEGKRVPMMISGKSLPSFVAYDTSARSGGYITGRFLTGIKPQEYYFHCMAGREGLIDTAVKTSRSGYLQRCLVKHLEGVRVHYDNTVRDSDGSVLQFLYGEDALDVCKQTTLTKFNFNAMNFRALAHRFEPEEMEDKLDQDSVRRHFKAQRKRKESSNPNTLDDPVISIYSPGNHIGSVSDKFKASLEKYLLENPLNLIKADGLKRAGWQYLLIKSKHFQAVMHLKYMNSLVEPGESVGLLAAQSIGEPSTQMTLNTFHFAGFGAKNVTLGIPRLREIIMTASSSIKTPLMKIPLEHDVTEEEKELLCERISKLVLGQVITGVSVDETFVAKVFDFHKTNTSPRMKLLKLRIEFWDPKDYKKQYSLTPKDLAKILEMQFIPGLERAIANELKKGKKTNLAEIGKGKKAKATKETGDDEDETISKSKSGKFVTGNESEEEPDSEVEGDGDVAEISSKKKKTQHSTYDESESDNEIDENTESADVESTTEQESVIQDEQSTTKRIIIDSKFVSDYDFEKSGNWCKISMQFSADTQKLLMVSLAEEVAWNVIIHRIPGIDRCFPQPNDNENDTSVNLGTEGCNIRGLWDYADKIKVDEIYTNDISAILNTYGVEAARSAITMEIASVFGVYGIDVDPRHLSLIGDYMTFEGGYKAFNRIAMESNPSPFSQMSFERTSHFLTNATLAGGYEDMKSPSARIVMGQVVEGGTGCFDVVQPI